MNKTSWIIFSIVTVAILAGLVMFSSSNNLDVSKIDATKLQTANEQNGMIADHVYGKIGSKVTLINYGDFQCPHCADMHIIVKEVVEEYKEQIQFVFRNFSISSFPNSKAASAAAEAAGLQGKYWEMHNKIYEFQSEWSGADINKRTQIFEKYATELKLDTDKFKTDMASSEVIKKIDYDYKLGQKVGVEGTPTFFLNGSMLELNTVGEKSKFKDAINTKLKKAGIALPK